MRKIIGLLVLAVAIAGLAGSPEPSLQAASLDSWSDAATWNTGRIPQRSDVVKSGISSTGSPIPSSIHDKVRKRQVWRPTPGTSWQWQLTGEIDTSLEVQMYDIDLFDTPQGVIDELHADGRVVICYFSAGSWEDWRPDTGGFPRSMKGNSNGWPGERWLDIRRLDTLGPIMEARLDLAVKKGCNGVEPDNVDGYTNNTGFPLTYEDQIAFNTFLAQAAHQRGLSVGLKNDLEQVTDLLPYFDWALNEECFQYAECDRLLPFIQAGKAVFQVEYQLSTSRFCPKANAMNFDSLKKGEDLDAWRIPCR